MTGKKTKLPDLQTGDFDLERRSLCVAVDETGDEGFKSKEAFFAIGGIAGLTPELKRAVRQWRTMKGRSFGGPDEPLHASGKMLSRQQVDEISAFFAKSRLTRFVYIIKRPPIMPPSLNALHLLREMLMEDLARAVIEMPTLPDEIVISIEKSERLLPKIVAVLPSVSCIVDNKVIPIVGLFTPKLPPEPISEMADHVAWRAQRQYKEHNSQKTLMPEFVSVFPKGAPFARYKEFKVASMSGGSDPKWRIDFDEQGVGSGYV